MYKVHLIRASYCFYYLFYHKILHYKVKPKKEHSQLRKGFRIFKTKVLSKAGLFDVPFHYPEALYETDTPPSIFFIQLKL
jgi:hypothetical protein